jgi:hypothetical protein
MLGREPVVERHMPGKDDRYTANESACRVRRALLLLAAGIVARARSNFE